MQEDVLFVGIGSDHGDDRAGWLVAEHLSTNARGMNVRRAKAPIDLLHWLEGVRLLGICDACRGAGPVGRWRRWAWPDLDASFERPSGTHLYGLSDTLQLATRLGLLPQRVLLWGIEIASAGPGDQLTGEVEEAIQEVAGDVAIVMGCHELA